MVCAVALKTTAVYACQNAYKEEKNILNTDVDRQ